MVAYFSEEDPKPLATMLEFQPPVSIQEYFVQVWGYTKEGLFIEQSTYAYEDNVDVSNTEEEEEGTFTIWMAVLD